MFSVVQANKGQFSLCEDNFQMKILCQLNPGHWYKTILREFKHILFHLFKQLFRVFCKVCGYCLFLSLFFSLLLFENVNAGQCLLCTLESSSHLQKEKYLCHLKCRLSFQIKILIVKYVLYYKSTKILLISGVRS